MQFVNTVSSSDLIWLLYAFRICKQNHIKTTDRLNMGNQNSTGNSDLAEGIEFIAQQVELDLQCSSSHSAEVQSVSMVMVRKEHIDGGHMSTSWN